MEIQHIYSIVAICLLSANVYASSTAPTPSSQEPSSTVQTSSSADPSNSSIETATSTPPPSSPSASADTNASSSSVTSPTTSVETSSALPDTSTVIPTSSGSPVVNSSDPTDSSSVDTTTTSNQTSSSVSTTDSSASSAATSPQSVDTSSITQPPVSASASPSASPSDSPSATPSDPPSATPLASTSPDTNNESSTPTVTPTTESSNDSSVESSPTSPSNPSASPESNTSATPVEGSTGVATSPGPDSNTSDASSPAASASPSSTDSTASSQPPPTSPVESTSVTTPASPVETTQPPLSTSFPSFSAKTDVARYQLSLDFTGDNDGPTTSCNDSALQSELEDKLKTTDGYSETIRTSNKKFSAIYKAKQLYGKTADDTTKHLEDAMSANPSCFNYTAYNDSFQQSFGIFAALTDDYCKADEICNTGYTCRDRNGSPLCISLCEGHECQNDGVCVVVVKEDGQAAAQCRCTDNNEQVFSGDKCEEARMNPDRVAAIVGAVLGAFCFILLVALYCMCYRKRERSGQKYHLSGVYNETYDRSSLDMKNL